VGLPEHVAGDPDGLLPAALLELATRFPGQEVQTPRVQVAVDAVLDARSEHGLALRVRPPAQQRRGEVRVRPRDVLLQVVRQRQLEAALERTSPALVTGEELRTADVVERVHERFDCVQPLGQFDRAPAPPDCFAPFLLQHRDLAEIAVRHSELRAFGQLLEQLDRLAGRAFGVRVATVEPVEA
jgi:hypothetical protein